LAGGEKDAFKGEEVVAEVFAGVGNDGGAGGGVQKLHAEHEYILWHGAGNGARQQGASWISRRA
jgi:hypothetical protein